MNARFASLIVATALTAMIPRAAHTDRDRAELKGPVKTVSTRWQANHKDQYGDVEERQLGSKDYDRDGNLLVEHELTPDFARDRTPERHGKNETVFRSRMGNATERYVFDAQDNVIEQRTWYDDRASGPAKLIQRLKYDAPGLVIERSVAGEDDHVLSRVLYSRDADGTVSVEESQNSREPPPYARMHYTYKFDSHGNWTERIVKRENVAEDSYAYRYAGNLFRTIVYFDTADLTSK